MCFTVKQLLITEKLLEGLLEELLQVVDLQ